MHCITRLIMSKEKIKSTAPAKTYPRAANLQIPEDSNVLLHDFCEKHPELNKTDVVRAALSRFLPELTNGSALIVNGKLVYREELQSAAA